MFACQNVMKRVSLTGVHPGSVERTNVGTHKRFASQWSISLGYIDQRENWRIWNLPRSSCVIKHKRKMSEQNRGIDEGIDGGIDGGMVGNRIHTSQPVSMIGITCEQSERGEVSTNSMTHTEERGNSTYDRMLVVDENTVERTEMMNNGQYAKRRKVFRNQKRIATFDPTKLYALLPCVSKRVKDTWYRMPQQSGSSEVSHRHWCGKRLRSSATIQRGREHKRTITPEKRLRDKQQRIKRNYGLTVEQYEAMFDGKGCSICSKHLMPYTKDANIDHLPGTGWTTQRVDGKYRPKYNGVPAVVRGILCTRCNHAMSFVDDAAWLERAIQYRNRTAEG